MGQQTLAADDREPPVVERKYNCTLVIGDEGHLGGFVGRDHVHDRKVFTTMATPKWDVVSPAGTTEDGFQVPNQTLREAESVGASRVIIHLVEDDDTEVWEFGMSQYRGRAGRAIEADDLDYSWVPRDDALHYYSHLPSKALFKREFEAACTHIRDTRGWN